MRLLFSFMFLTLSAFSFSQHIDSLNSKHFKSPKVVSFITKLDMTYATKDGIYLNGYVVNISYDKMKELNGKTIKVTGKVTLIKAIKNVPGEILTQGREVDTKHILKPKIKVIRL